MTTSGLSLQHFAAEVRRQAKAINTMEGKEVITEQAEVQVYLDGLSKEFLFVKSTLLDTADISHLTMPKVIKRVQEWAFDMQIDCGATSAVKVFKLDTAPICNNFQKGACRWGDKCKYRHVKKNNSTTASSSPSTSSASTDKPKKFEGKCRHCGKKGHKIAECRQRKKDEEKKAEETTYVEVEEDFDNVFMLQDAPDEEKGSNQDDIDNSQIAQRTFEGRNVQVGPRHNKLKLRRTVQPSPSTSHDKASVATLEKLVFRKIRKQFHDRVELPSTKTSRARLHGKDLRSRGSILPRFPRA